MLSRSKIFLILCLSFITGVLIAPVLSKLAVSIAAILFVMVESIFWSSKWARLIGLAGLVLLLGSMRFITAAEKNNLSVFYDKQTSITGIVLAEPDIRSDKIYLTLGKLLINEESINDKILVSFYPNHNFSYGDEIKITGKLQEPAVFDDFNYKNYLSRFGINAVMYYPQFDIANSKKGNIIKASLIGIKQKFVSNLSKVLPEPQNAFLGGLLVGNKRTIPESLTNAFNTTGTSHIVAISGFNITIIVWALDWLLERFGRRISFFINLLVILGFIVITGASSSVIRAGIMVSLLLIAKNIGRLYHPTNALAFSAAAMIAVNPKILLFDVGFQLSFFALAGLIYLSPIFIRLAARLPIILRESLVATISAQVFALPILLYNFETFSLVSPLTNVLILPVVPITMFFGFITGLAGFIWPALSALSAWPAYILLSYIITIVQWTASFPFASIEVGLNLIGIVSYYTALLCFLWFYQKRTISQAAAEKESFTKFGFLANLYRH